MNFQLAKRTKRHPLSKPQLEVLQKLAERGSCPTSSRTAGVFVSGTAAAALERRGLVYASMDGEHGWLGRTFKLTDAGRKVLARAQR